MTDDIQEEGYKQYDGLWGESLAQLKSRLVYQRKSEMICLYCGLKADTREHCPPKSFLKKPYPNNLKIIPACSKCNNGYSKFENLFLQLINEIESGNISDYLQSDISMMIEKHILPDYALITIKKVAIGHAAYQLSEFFGDTVDDYIEISFVLRNEVSKNQWEMLQKPQKTDVIPELGSRGSGEIIIIRDTTNQKSNHDSFAIADWIDVQTGIYKYLSFVDDEHIVVNMVFRDILFVKVVM